MQYYKNDLYADEFEQLQKNELVQFELLKKLLNEKFGSMVDQLGLSFSFELVRWTEDSYHKGHNYDGYTATLEAKILKNGSILCAPNNDAEYTFLSISVIFNIILLRNHTQFILFMSTKAL